MPSVRHHTNAIASSSTLLSTGSSGNSLIPPADGASGIAHRRYRTGPALLIALASLALALVAVLVAGGWLGGWSPLGSAGYHSATVNGATALTPQTGGLVAASLQLTALSPFVALLANSNLLFMLFIVAAICIYLELAHPGAIVPGVVGSIALLLFLAGSFAIQPNWAGFALMLLAIVLLAVDVRAPTHGVLTLGGLISLVIGSLLFFDSGANSGVSGVSPFIILSFAAGVGVVALIVLRAAITAQRRRVASGKEAYIGQVVTVIEPLAPEGRVRLLGENWLATLAPRFTQPDIRLTHEPTAPTGPGAPAATAPTATAPTATAPTFTAPGLAVGAQARVVRVEGLRLIVEPTQQD